MPIDRQGNQETYFTQPPAQYWTDCGYRYEAPSLLALPPTINVPVAPVPEPAVWVLMLPVIAVYLVWLLVRRKVRRAWRLRQLRREPRRELRQAVNEPRPPDLEVMAEWLTRSFDRRGPR